jgi:hypothetical protein
MPGSSEPGAVWQVMCRNPLVCCMASVHFMTFFLLLLQVAVPRSKAVDCLAAVDQELYGTSNSIYPVSAFTHDLSAATAGCCSSL